MQSAMVAEVPSVAADTMAGGWFDDPAGLVQALQRRAERAVGDAEEEREVASESRLPDLLEDVQGEVAHGIVDPPGVVPLPEDASVADGMVSSAEADAMVSSAGADAMVSSAEADGMVSSAEADGMVSSAEADGMVSSAGADEPHRAEAEPSTTIVPVMAEPSPAITEPPSAPSNTGVAEGSSAMAVAKPARASRWFSRAARGEATHARDPLGHTPPRCSIATVHHGHYAWPLCMATMQYGLCVSWPQ